MQFYLAHNKEKSGPFTYYQVRERLFSEEIAADDLGWHEELDAWKPLREIPALERIFKELETPREGGEGGEGGATKVETVVTGFLRGGKNTGSCPQIRPFVRFWARFFDIFLFSSAIWLIIGVEALPEPPKSEEEFEAFFAIARRLALMEAAILLSWNFVEALFIFTYGTTPGKALFRIQIRREDGTLPSYFCALQRSLHVWIAGYAFGIPILRELMILVFFFRLTNEGTTPWDRAQGTVVRHERIGELRILAAISLFLTVAAILNLVAAR
ncbi:MAG: RDD family protein [Verrucomicrobiales bacterium]